MGNSLGLQSLDVPVDVRRLHGTVVCISSRPILKCIERRGVASIKTVLVKKLNPLRHWRGGGGGGGKQWHIRDLKIVVYDKRLTSDTLLAIKTKSLTVKYITYRVYSKYRKLRIDLETPCLTTETWRLILNDFLLK